jgi:radical SAM superfamily enzyme YgiQ (UPF0313 family)
MTNNDYGGNMKKIALIKPNTESFISPHTGLGYLSSYLKQNGYSTLIIDGHKDRLSNEAILSKLLENEINIAGITCVSSYYWEAVELSKRLKENGIQVVIGGIHPTFMPYQTLIDSKADYVVCGEGEIALLSLLKNNMSNVIQDSVGGGYDHHKRCLLIK